MALRNIREEGDPILRKKAREVTEINERITDLLDDLAETMRSVGGVGLAAPQVGVLRRVVVVEVEGQLYELINPVITYTEGDQFEYEGCLSVPGKQGKVHRPAVVKLEALDRDGNKVEYEGTDLLARAFCHETDHLNGVLFIDKAEIINEGEDIETDEEDEDDEE